MDEKRILDKLEQLDNKLGKIELILDRNTYSLEIHEKRTTISEQRLAHIEQHVYLVTAMGKLALFLAGFSGFILTLLEIKKAFGR